MTSGLANLITAVAQLTAVPRPAWLDEDAPLLSDAGDAAQADEGFYLIGLIGGKEVGKSALVNALVGRQITERTSFGPGTEMAIAYAHESQRQPLAELLEREAAGKYRIVTHDIANLRRQVLIDLPDIDSHFAAHIALTRRMLRHMLFPIWAQSVEKYADRQPQQLLKIVASGNAPANFIFCLNKVDQIRNPADVRTLADDYAARLARLLALPAPPRVWAISALRPQAYELPALRQLLAQQKSPQDVHASRDLAAARQRASVLAWLDEQQLPARATRLARLQEDAEDVISERIGQPLLEVLLPRLEQDPARRRAILEDCLAQRVRRWPIVNVLHPLYWAIGALVRRNSEPRAAVAASLGGEALVDAHLADLASVDLASSAPPPVGASATRARKRATRGQSQTQRPAQNLPTPGLRYSEDPDNPTAQSGSSDHLRTGARTTTSSAPAAIAQHRTLASMIQSAFALLQQSHPAVSAIYRDNKPWEALPAAMATDDLRRRLSAAIDRQRKLACARIDSGTGALGVVLRGVLTIGALLWFPFVQPMLEQFQAEATDPLHTRRGILPVLTHALSMNNLLDTLFFFAIYYTVIWLILRWDTQRRIDWRAARRKQTEAADPTINLTVQTVDWLSGLLTPIREERDRVDHLAARIEALRESVGKAAV